MICDFQQIQGGPQISFSINNLLASLNLLEKTEFTKSDDAEFASFSAPPPFRP